MVDHAFPAFSDMGSPKSIAFRRLLAVGG